MSMYSEVSAESRKTVIVHEQERVVLYDHNENEVIIRSVIGFRPADAEKGRSGR